MKRPIYKLLALLTTVIFCSYAVPLQKQKAAKAIDGPQTPLSSNAENKKLVLDGLEHIYNFDFAVAESHIAKIKQKIPNHPIYHMLMAMNLDWQWEPTIEDKSKQIQILAHLNKTLIECDSILTKKNKNDLEVMFIQFTAHGFLARVYAILGNYMDAVNHSMAAYNAVKKGFELKDKFHDFYFSTGMYNYYRERYPELHPVIKPFASMLSHGNPELGIKQLRFAYANSLFSKIESANYLINLFYKYEAKPLEAFDVAEDVHKKHPSNLFFMVKYAEGVMLTKKDKTELLSLGDKLTSSNNIYYQMCGNYFKAQKYYAEGKIDEALVLAAKAGKTCDKLNKLKDNMPAYIYILLGKINVKKNNTKEAEKYFKLAASRAEYPTSKREAQAHLKALPH